ncbi:hypothetical protein JCM3765_007594 [Sporobolomyces pararoseus]
MVSDPIPPTPNLSPPPPSNSFLFSLNLSTPITRRPSIQDPRVSLREWPNLSYRQQPTSSEQREVEDEEEGISLMKVREFEGKSKRLERLRQVFESIPDPPSTTNTTPTIVESTDEEEKLTKLEEERKRWEMERKIYMKELWNKCGADNNNNSTTPSKSTSSPCLRWSSFESYADSQEKLLYSIFKELDSNNSLKLTPLQVEQACKKNGVEGVDKNLIEGFVKVLDKDGDGMIGWEEWRDFLILLPRKPSVKEIFHYYRSQTRSSRPSMSRLTQDGDVVIGRGKTSFNRFLKSTSSSSSSNPSSSTALSSITNTTSSSSSYSSSSLGGGNREKERKRMFEKCNLHKQEEENSRTGIECRWAREERENKKKKRKSSSIVSSSTTTTKGLDFESSGVLILDDDDHHRNKDDKEQSKEVAVMMIKKKEKSEEKEKKKLVMTAEKEESSINSTPSSSSTPIPPTRKISTPSKTTLSPTTKPIEPVKEEEGDEEEEEEEEEPGMFAGAGKFLLAGGMAGAVSRTATAPFDRLKVYLITSPSSPKPSPTVSTTTTTPSSSSSTSSLKPKKTPRRNAGSLAAAVRAVYSQGGVKAFWTGNMLNVIKIFPESAIKFLSYESAKRIFAQHWDCVPDQTMISNTSRFISGGIGGVISQLSIYPIESLKTRVMSSTGGDKKGNALILQTFLDMYRKGGLTFFFRGLPAGLIGVFPYAAIDMSTFEGIKISYTKWAGEEPGIAGSLCFGAVSGGVGATSVYPLNLVRTRLQAQGTPAHPQVYTGIRDAAIKCYQREGWRGFYKGLTPTLVKVVPAVAISYAVYDQSKRLLFGKEEDHSSSNDSSEEA